MVLSCDTTAELLVSIPHGLQNPAAAQSTHTAGICVSGASDPPPSKRCLFLSDCDIPGSAATSRCAFLQPLPTAPTFALFAGCCCIPSGVNIPAAFVEKSPLLPTSLYFWHIVVQEPRSSFWNLIAVMLTAQQLGDSCWHSSTGSQRCYQSQAAACASVRQAWAGSSIPGSCRGSVRTEERPWPAVCC